MNKEYFVPQIEDFRVGYICELFQTFSDNDIIIRTEWGKVSLIKNAVIFLLQTNEKLNTLIRTPYLTKEQIEKEGWEYSTSSEENNRVTKKEDKYIEFNRKKSNDASKGIFTDNELTYFINTHKLVIDNGESYDDSHCYFDGECKSINEFRYITKLLKI